MLPSGQKLFDSQYEKVKELGKGAFGTAYQVRPRQGRRVYYVAKEIRVSHLSEKERDGALAEAEVLKMMGHPNIVAYVNSFYEDGNMYIVMEFADGGDLAEKIKKRKEAQEGGGLPFEEHEIMFIFVQLALALLHIHARKVLHRDLKPLNVFLTKDGLVKLGDFGIARVMESTTAAAQTMIGSPLYLSPEIVNSEPYGLKSDLWALGVLTYELMALKVPFHGNSLPAVAVKICSADPDPLPDRYSKDLCWIVMGFLHKDPPQRPRLEAIVRLPYVQRFVGLLRSHSMTSGTGGCEAMLTSNASRPRRPASPRAAQLAIDEGHHAAAPRHKVMTGIARPAAGAAATKPIARRETVGGLMRLSEDDDSWCLEDHRQSFQAAYNEKPTYHKAEIVTRGGGSRHQQSAQQAGFTEAYRDPHWNFNDFDAERIPAGRSSSSSEQQRLMQLEAQNEKQQMKHLMSLEEAERHKEEVRRKGQQDRDNQVQARQQELARAMREAEEDRRRIRDKILAREREAEAAAERTIEEQFPENERAAEEQHAGGAVDKSIELVQTHSERGHDALDNTLQDEDILHARQEAGDTLPADSLAAALAPREDILHARQEAGDTLPADSLAAALAPREEAERVDLVLHAEPQPLLEHLEVKVRTKYRTAQLRFHDDSVSVGSADDLEADSDADTVAAGRQGRADRGRRKDSEQEAATSSTACPSDDAEEGRGDGKGFAICIPMTEFVKAKPKLSSEGRQQRQARGGSHVNQEAATRGSSVGHSASNEGRSASRGRGQGALRRQDDSAGGGGVVVRSREPPSRRRVQSRDEALQGGDNSPARGSTSPPPSADRRKRQATESRQRQSSGSLPAVASAAPRSSQAKPPRPPPPMKRASGNPAQWLRSPQSPSGAADPAPQRDDVIVIPASAFSNRRRQPKQPRSSSLPAAASNSQAQGASQEADSLLLQAPPTPQGGNDVSMLQDALANVLCPVEGHSRTTEFADQELGAGDTTRISIRADWQDSECECG
eukprot:TRINITY_DN20139_c0_g2_i1.p1 TRINITY_DN20139_c0_g2~~TRINITY_DN20139_c0_g2_i1.p1  ORF type:complete len:1008 (-),score=244.44 TRINITY_DN20139_c0_g2_i1:43-3066(-)